MALTEDQLRLWRIMQTHVPKPSGGQTEQQAINLKNIAASYLWACDFTGVDTPTVQ